MIGDIAASLEADLTALNEGLRRAFKASDGLRISLDDTDLDACPYCGTVSEYRPEWPWCLGCGAPLR